MDIMISTIITRAISAVIMLSVFATLIRSQIKDANKPKSRMYLIMAILFGFTFQIMDITQSFFDMSVFSQFIIFRYLSYILDFLLYFYLLKVSLEYRFAELNVKVGSALKKLMDAFLIFGFSTMIVTYTIGISHQYLHNYTNLIDLILFGGMMFKIFSMTMCFGAGIVIPGIGPIKWLKAALLVLAAGSIFDVLYCIYPELMNQFNSYESVANGITALLTFIGFHQIFIDKKRAAERAALNTRKSINKN